MRGNIAQMMQQAQRAQDNIKRVELELAQFEVTGQSGGGVVAITITCKFETRRVHIDPSVLADAEMLEDMVSAALNDASPKQMPKVPSACRSRQRACSCRPE